MDADLGGHVLKKRVPLVGRGKRGGLRTLLVYKAMDRAFFVYGFAKNAKANIKEDELKGLKMYAGVLLNFNSKALARALETGALVEVARDG